MRETDGRRRRRRRDVCEDNKFSRLKAKAEEKVCADAATGKNYHNVAKHSPSTKLRVGVAQTEDMFKNFPFIFPQTNHV